MNEKEYKIIWLEVKSPEWKIATLSDDVAQYANTSINKVNKKGEVFPNFDEISNGGSVKGNLWQSPQGKYYLFAPKLNAGANKASGGYKTQVIEKAMERKDASIGKFQDNKEQSIKISSTMRDAVLLTIAEKGDGVMTAEDMAENIIKWRKWLVNHWEDADIPF